MASLKNRIQSAEQVLDMSPEELALHVLAVAKTNHKECAVEFSSLWSAPDQPGAYGSPAPVYGEVGRQAWSPTG